MKKRGVITLVFDDGYQIVFHEVLPLLASYNVRAVFAIPLRPEHEMISGEAVAPVSDWLGAAKEYGHEIAAHGITHTNMTTFSEAQLDEELETPALELAATTIVYPGGAYNNAIVKKAKKTYTAGRTTLRGFASLPPKHVMCLPTINFAKRNFSVARANIHALRALCTNTWLIETYHMVSKESSYLTHSALLEDLDAHLDFITSLPIRIATIRETLDYL